MSVKQTKFAAKTRPKPGQISRRKASPANAVLAQKKRKQRLTRQKMKDDGS